MVVIAVERLVLVRHAMPEVDPATPSDSWQLGHDGRAAARALRSAVPEPMYPVASDEPKALQTLQELTGRVEVPTDAGFREVARPYEWSGSDYRQKARAYVEGARHSGWEPHERVAERFHAAVARYAEEAATAGATLVIGTHGLAPTIWLTSLMPLHPSPAAFWVALAFPDVVDVDLPTRTARRRADGGRTTAG